jgi:hypothetical protein
MAVDPVTPLRLPVMLDVPAPTPVAKPPWIVATDCCDDAQLTSLVMSFVVLSEYVPVAFSCAEAPLPTVETPLIWMEASVAACVPTVTGLETLIVVEAVAEG